MRKCGDVEMEQPIQFIAETRRRGVGFEISDVISRDDFLEVDILEDDTSRDVILCEIP